MNGKEDTKTIITFGHCKTNSVKEKMGEYNSPIYSKRWLGRPFILDGNSLRWGRYIIIGPTFHGLPSEDSDITATALRGAEPGRIATGFEQLIRLFMPYALLDYLAEISALYTYELAKKNLAVLKRIECEPTEYIAARTNVAARFEDALLTVFNSASSIHGLGKADAVRYCQMLHGMHDVAISIQGTTCYAAFTSDLVLETIAGYDNFRLWPPYPPREDSKHV
jgi:hypothetical protein